MYKRALITGTVTACLAVILGAMGSHAIRDLVTPETLAIYKTGVEYQFYHSFALIAAGILYSAFPVKQVKLAGTFFLTGIILFSGSLYLLTYLKTTGGNFGPFGLLTPLGGVCFIVGWLLLLVGLLKKQ